MNPAIMIRSIQSKISFNATSLAQAYPEYSQPNDPNIFYETKNFTVKLVSTRKEYMKIQKLRYKCFTESLETKNSPNLIFQTLFALHHICLNHRVWQTG